MTQPTKTTKKELAFLRDLAEAPRPNAWVIQNYGMGLAYYLCRRGLVIINPPEWDGTTHTNLWQPSERGKLILESEAMPG